MNQEPSQRQEIITSYFNLIAQNQVEAAIEFIFSDMSSWISRDSILQMRQQLLISSEYLGVFIGYEYLSDITISKRYAIDYYFCYYERQPIFYEFTFYRPGISWRVQNINFQAEFESFIKKASISWHSNS